MSGIHSKIGGMQKMESTVINEKSQKKSKANTDVTLALKELLQLHPVYSNS